MSNELPTVTVQPNTLPSKGLCYPKGSYFTYTGYTYGEVQMISGSRKMTYLEVMKRAHSAIRVQGTRMNPNDITLFDVLYLGIARKLSTLGGNEFEITAFCEAKKCNAEYKKVFNQADIKFKDIEAPELPLCVTLSNNVELEFSPITVGDFYELSEGGMFYKAMGQKGNKTLFEDPIAVKAAQVKNMKFLEAYEMIKNLTDAEDSELMDEIDTMLLHNIEPLTHTCEACGRENTLQLEGKESLIKPFRTGDSTIRNRIRFGKGTTPKPLALEADGVLGSNGVEQNVSGTN
jgi:hypothetical protein